MYTVVGHCNIFGGGVTIADYWLVNLLFAPPCNNLPRHNSASRQKAGEGTTQEFFTRQITTESRFIGSQELPAIIRTNVTTEMCLFGVSELGTEIANVCSE